MPTRVLFVCSGNICRSPMAEGIAREYARVRERKLEVRSAGTLGLVGRPAHPKAVAACRELDIDISAHRSQALSDALVAWADYLLVMEYHHSMYLLEHYPSSNDKRLLLGSFGGVDQIPDPLAGFLGGWRFRFRQSRDLIQRSVERFVDTLPHEA